MTIHYHLVLFQLRHGATTEEELIPYSFWVGFCIFFQDQTLIEQVVSQSSQNQNWAWPVRGTTGMQGGIAEHTDHASDSPFFLLLRTHLPHHSDG